METIYLTIENNNGREYFTAFKDISLMHEFHEILKKRKSAFNYYPINIYEELSSYLYWITKECNKCGKPNHDDDYVCGEPISIKTLIPFDLEKALAGETVINRIGKKISEIFESKARKNNHLYPLIITFENGDVDFYSISGKYLEGSGESDNDLFMAPKPKQIRWVNIYKCSEDEDDYTIGAIMYKSAEEAQNSARGISHILIKTISFEL